MGPTAAPAIDVLINRIEFALSDHREGLKTWYAAEALGNIGKPALKSVPVLKRALQSEDKKFVREAQMSLEKVKSLGYYEYTSESE